MTRFALVLGVLGCAFVPSVWGEEPPSAGEKARSVRELIGSLDSSDNAVRLEAIAALADRGKNAAEAVDALLKQLDAEDPAVRGSAATAMGKIGVEGDKVVPVLIEHFSDGGFVERYEPRYEVIPLFAVYGMAAASFGEVAVDPLVDALGSDSQQAYVGAAVGLETMGEPAAKAMPQIMEMLGGSDAKRRNVAAGIIRGIGPGAAEAVPALVKLLHDEDFHTQYWACRALGAIGPASATASGDLLDLLVNGTVSVRRNAAMALGNIGPGIGPEAAAALIGVVEKEFMAPVREEAVIALGKLKPYAKDSVPPLKKALENPDFPAPTHAARSLWLLTGDANEALPTLMNAMNDLTHFQHAVEVLGEMGPDAAPAVDRLIEALGQRDPDDRVAAALALARIGSPAAKAEPALKKLLDDERRVREAAKSALEALSNT